MEICRFQLNMEVLDDMDGSFTSGAKTTLMQCKRAPQVLVLAWNGHHLRNDSGAS